MTDDKEDKINLSKGVAAILLGGVAIGSAAVFMRLAPVSPPSSAFWRVAISVPVLGLLFLIKQKRNPSPAQKQETTKPMIWPMVWVGLWFAADLFFWHWSVMRTTVANATLLAILASVFTIAIGFLFFGQRVSRVFLLGLVLALTGAVFLVGQNFAFKTDYLFGDFLGLLTAFALTGYLITASRARQQCDTIELMLGSAFFCALALLPIALWQDGAFIPAAPTGWLPLLGLAVVTHCMGQGLLVYGLAHVPAAVGAIGLLIQPVVAAVFAYFVFAEALGLLQIFGGILILGGIAVTQKRGA